MLNVIVAGWTYDILVLIEKIVRPERTVAHSSPIANNITARYLSTADIEVEETVVMETMLCGGAIFVSAIVQISAIDGGHMRRTGTASGYAVGDHAIFDNRRSEIPSVHTPSSIVVIL
jgi:hypothetical protein